MCIAYCMCVSALVRFKKEYERMPVFDGSCVCVCVSVDQSSGEEEGEEDEVEEGTGGEEPGTDREKDTQVSF